MILILSNESDGSTIKVIKWFNYFGLKYVRINKEDTFTVKSITLNNDGEIDVILKNNSQDQIIDLSKVKAYWYRRGKLNLSKLNLNINISNELKRSVSNFMHLENCKLKEIIYNVLYSLPKLCSFELADLNKLLVLKKARQQGLLVPKTKIVTNSLSFDQNSTIFKPISDPYRFQIEDVIYMSYTELSKDINWEPIFFPTLI